MQRITRAMAKKGQKKKEDKGREEQLPPLKKAVPSYSDAMKGELFEMVPSLWSDSVKIPQPPVTPYYNPTAGNGIKACLQPISKELTSLLSLLPCNPSASIFVRVEEGRIDALKVIMTGPAGTPYAFGCFEFNVAFPSNYPQIPPHAQLLTTGGGTVRFNPNLYNCGKICVSLLGTWPGQKPEERWQPGKSTLLQVLVSVQSLIMVEFPFFNEPGYESLKSPTYPASIAYNQNLHVETVRHAIVGQLRNTTLLETAGFGKVIRNHFFLCKDDVKKQVADWAKAANPASKTLWNTLIKEVNVEFDKLTSLQ
ncbi:ubiquitin-conjugating enzyme/RWD-like protein [Obelidium mucronatum]|nr:ubiquitin-conjugating enzyme/RWD-like protein [Obelidium mucronatum]